MMCIFRAVIMSASTTISPEYKIEIPAEVRGKKGWRAGQEMIFLPEGDSFVLVPLPLREDLRGIARGANPDGYRDRNDRY